jgi:hypothetical protein
MYALMVLCMANDGAKLCCDMLWYIIIMLPMKP